MGGIEPLPRYIIQEAFVPASDEIMEQLQEYHRSLIGTSYYYIRVEDEYAYLYRILPGAGKFFFHEVVYHEKHGISDDDIEQAVNMDIGMFSIGGYHPISAHIENKLRVLLEYP